MDVLIHILLGVMMETHTLLSCLEIQKVKKEQIIAIIDLIPADWNITNEEKNALVNYIYNRFQRIDEILEILNIKGGVINEF